MILISKEIIMSVKDSLSRLRQTHLTRESILRFLTGSDEVLFLTKEYSHYSLPDIVVDDS